MKECIVCGTYHNRIKFCSDKCKHTNWRKLNPKKSKLKTKIWRDKNIEHTKDYSAKYRENNKEYYINWRKNNLDKGREYSAKYKKNNADKVKEYNSRVDVKKRNKEKATKWAKDNPNKIKKIQKKYEENNKDKRKVWRKNNSDKCYGYSKKWIENNREQRREICRNFMNKYFIERRKNDVEFRILCNLRRRLHHALKGVSKSDSTGGLLGCGVDELRAHLASMFVEGMSWENYGSFWHVDHIVPCASFDLSKEEEQRKAFHFSNLQPLWAKDNLKKGAKLDYVVGEQ